MSENNKIDVSRRRVLAIGGIAGAAVIAGATPMVLAGVDKHVPTWDLQTDIVVVGSGAAACSAAVTAVDLGSKVMMLEKAPILGGTTRRSGGVAWIPNNFSLRAQGIDDNEQDCMRYMCRYAYPQRYRADSSNLGLEPLEYQRLLAFYRNAGPAVDRFNALKATHFIRFDLPGGIGPSPDYSPRLSENKVPRGRSVWPDPTINGGRGSSIVDNMAAWLEQHGASLLTEHQVVGLIQDEGRVIGVEVEHQGRRLRVKARKGVIFGSGGYAHNRELTTRYQQGLLYGACAAAGSTGDLVQMASSVGARLGDMQTAWRSQVVLEEALENPNLGTAVNVPPGDAMILVNKYGRRVVNEKRNYNDRTKVHFIWDPSNVEYTNQFLFMVFDQRAIDVFGGNYPFPNDVRESPYLISAGSFEELAKNVQARLDSLKQKIPAITLASDFIENLKGSVERFSESARKGIDAEFHRGSDPAETDWLAYFSRPRKGLEAEARKMPNATLYPFTVQGPYYAIIIAPGALDTNSGPQVDSSAQVLGADGQPIPGLYGAGNCIASPSHNAYFGAGGTIGPALAFGYIAARAASAQKGVA